MWKRKREKKKRKKKKKQQQVGRKGVRKEGAEEGWVGGKGYCIWPCITNTRAIATSYHLDKNLTTYTS